jgi:hypothetical protein
VLQREWQRRRPSGRRQQRREIQALVAKIMIVLGLPIGGSLDGRPVGIGVRDRAQLGDEQRQRCQRSDAKFDAMRPFEHGKMLAP